MESLFPIISPERLFSRAEVLQRPSLVPAASGLYAWYFRDFPAVIPNQHAQRLEDRQLAAELHAARLAISVGFCSTFFPFVSFPFLRHLGTLLLSR